MLSASRSAKATVLVVEDDQASRELMTRLLQLAGFDVIATATGERALLTLCQHGDHIDWLVSRLHLPGLICGWILTDEYHEHHPNRPALLVSDSVGATRVKSESAVFIPSTFPMKVLEVLQALRHPKPGQALPFRTSQAA